MFLYLYKITLRKNFDWWSLNLKVRVNLKIILKKFDFPFSLMKNLKNNDYPVKFLVLKKCFIKLFKLIDWAKKIFKQNLKIHIVLNQIYDFTILI